MEVPEETKQKAYVLCKDFMGGTWAEISYNDFQIAHISGGLSNLLYCCSVPDKVIIQDGEVRKVLLRIYGQIIQENPETVVTDSVLFAILAEKKMGPKLWGVFTGGRVEEYVDSRHLNTKELHDPVISSACAAIMARFHKLKMPFRKEPTWLFDIMQRYLDDALNNVTFHSPDPDQKAKLQKVLSYELASELKCLKKLLAQADSKVVFCHNDLQEGNILFVQDDKNWEVRPIDFEYASYNYRGFDFGNHFCEWCYDYSITEPPYYAANIENYPTREQQLIFIRAYLAEDGAEGDYNQTEEEDHMILEADAFALASHFMWGLWSIVQNQVSTIQFGYLDYAICRFEAYFYQKSKVVEQLRLHGKQ